MPKRIETYPCTPENCGVLYPNRCGKISNYRKFGCRCEPCAATVTAYHKKRYEKTREQQLARANQYNAEHREERRAYDARYKAENRAVLNQRAIDRYWADPEAARQRVRDQRHNNREAHLAYRRQWRLDNIERELERERRYHDANREKRNAASAQYAKDNPEWNRRRAHIRRVKMQQGKIFIFTLRDWERTIARHRGECFYCGDKPNQLTQDHVIPVDRGGSHSVGNIVPACKKCNSSKSDKTITEWRAGKPSPSRVRRRKTA